MACFTIILINGYKNLHTITSYGKSNTRWWQLNLFFMFHPQKLGKIRFHPNFVRIRIYIYMFQIDGVGWLVFFPTHQNQPTNDPATQRNPTKLRGLGLNKIEAWALAKTKPSPESRQKGLGEARLVSWCRVESWWSLRLGRGISG